MKRGKDGEKLLRPMFPRLHVNDAEKGGPRAPPRNKMALYEQLSVPSQRFDLGLLPGKPNSNNLVPPSSSNQVSGMDRKNFFPLHLPLSKPTYLPEKLNGQEPDRSHMSTSFARLGQQNNSADEDDFSVPVFARSQEGQEKNQNSKENENLAPLNLNHTHHHSPRIQTQNSGPDRNSVEPENIHGEESKEGDDGFRESGINESLRDTAVANASEPRRESISGNTERSDDASEASMLDSIPAMDISPDDVVGIIGQKHYWKARRAIVNQQIVFAVQVFELHRLIKVQKLMASSPHLLLEDTSTTEYNKSLSPAPKNRGEHDKPTHPVECSDENAVGWTPVVSNKSALPGPPTGSNSGPWCPPQQQSPGQQQWLIPMMSPTEGLVYKPYPASGFNGTGFCGPYGSSPVMIGNFGNPAYGVPTQQGMGFIPGIPHGCHSYFPTYGMPVMNAGASGASSRCISSVDAGNRQAESTPANQTSHDQRQELNNPQHQSSCNKNNVSVPRAAPAGARLQTPKISDIQGSTGSSHPNDRAKPTQTGSSHNPCPPDDTQGTEAGSFNERTKDLGNVRSGQRKGELRLFPMAPATAEAELSARVIRAVPRNPRSASASVARIFMSIQEERKHYDSV